MYELIMVTEKYVYYYNYDGGVKMFDKNKKLVAKGKLAINNMLLELELIQDNEISCEYIDKEVIDKFIMKYW